MLEIFDGTVKSTVHIWKSKSPRKFAANVKGQWGGRSRGVPSWACWSEKYQIYVKCLHLFSNRSKKNSVIFFRLFSNLICFKIEQIDLIYVPQHLLKANLREAGLLTSLKVIGEVDNNKSIQQPVEVVGRCCQGARRRRQGKWIVRSVASSRVKDPRPRPTSCQWYHCHIISRVPIFVCVEDNRLYHLSAKNGLNSSSDVPRVARWLRSWSGWWYFSLLANLDEWWDMRGPEIPVRGSRKKSNIVRSSWL